MYFSPHTNFSPIQLTIHESIRTLAIRVAQPGAAPRAQFLFDIAMQRAKLRWGRAAKLASGAALALALREASRGDLTNDIAVSESLFLSPDSPFCSLLFLSSL